MYADPKRAFEKFIENDYDNVMDFYKNRANQAEKFQIEKIFGNSRVPFQSKQDAESWVQECEDSGEDQL